MQTPAQVITYIADTTDEEEDMAPKTGPSLKELMRNRNRVPSPQEKNKSKQSANPPPPPPQAPADLGLKPNPDLRRKRPVEPTEEGEGLLFVLICPYLEEMAPCSYSASAPSK